LLFILQKACQRIHKPDYQRISYFRRRQRCL